MSDNWIRIIPESPELVPAEAEQQTAVSYLRSIAPEAEEIEASTSDCVVFVDCGGNFESIACPSCGSGIEMEQWQEWMDSDFDGKGFILRQHGMPCCGSQHTLHELRYEFPQGFGRFELSATNPQIAEVSEEQRGRFQQILGCPVRVIYQHI